MACTIIVNVAVFLNAVFAEKRTDGGHVSTGVAGAGAGARAHQDRAGAPARRGGCPE